MIEGGYGNDRWSGEPNKRFSMPEDNVDRFDDSEQVGRIHENEKIDGDVPITIENITNGGNRAERNNAVNAEADTSGKTPVEAGNSAESSLDQNPPSFLEKKFESAKDFLAGLREKVYNIPGLNRVVGSMEIAYHQAWSDRHERKSAELATKVRELDVKAIRMDESKKKIESVLEGLEKDKVPGFDSLRIKLKEAEDLKAGVLEKRHKVQSQFELRQDKVKFRAEKRDAVADKLIGHYDEKLKPMQEHLEVLEMCRGRIDTLMVSTEERHKKESAKFNELENKKKTLEDAYKGLGMDEKRVRNDPTVLSLEIQLKTGREKIEVEKAELAKKLAEVEAKISKAQSKAEPYKDKRREFEDIKKRKPIDYKVDLRTREGEDITDVIEGSIGKKEFEEILSRTNKEETEVTPETRQNELKLESVNEKFTAMVLISGWNEHLKKTRKEKAKGALIDPKEFLEFANKNKVNWTEGTKITPKEFSDMLKRYYGRGKVTGKNSVKNNTPSANAIADIPYNPNSPLNGKN